MISIKNYSIIFISICFPLIIAGQNKLPFNVGEKLLYDASINLIKAGSSELFVASLDSIDNVTAYHIIFTTKTNRVVDRIYKVRDRVDTWIDSKGLFTRKLKKKIREGKYRYKLEAEVDYKDSVVISNSKTLKFKKELRDPYSLLFYLRATNFDVGDLFSFTTFDNDRFTDFQVIVRRKEKIKVPAGEFTCFVVKPFHPERSLFKSKGDMTIWLSDDERRLPVKIQSKAKFGSMIFKLRKVVTIE